MKLIAGSSHYYLAEKVANKLLVSLGKPNVKYFKDHEISVQVDTSVAGQDVYILQSLSHPINDHLVELLILINDLKQKNAKKIVGLIPYFGYGRSSSNSALIAKLLECSGVDQVVTIGLHNAEIETYFKVPIMNLDVTDLFGQDIQCRYKSLAPLIVSPDKGGEKRARELADYLKTDVAILYKERSVDGTVKITKIVGDVTDRNCIIVDDIVDSGTTLVGAAAALTEAGAISVEAYAIHAVLSEGAIERLEQSSIRSLTITDTVNQSVFQTKFKKIRTLGIFEILAKAIKPE